MTKLPRLSGLTWPRLQLHLAVHQWWFSPYVVLHWSSLLQHWNRGCLVTSSKTLHCVLFSLSLWRWPQSINKAIKRIYKTRFMVPLTAAKLFGTASPQLVTSVIQNNLILDPLFLSSSKSSLGVCTSSPRWMCLSAQRFTAPPTPFGAPFWTFQKSSRWFVWIWKYPARRVLSLVHVLRVSVLADGTIAQYIYVMWSVIS